MGSVLILSRPASRRALSLPVWSTSRNRSMSLGVGSTGTQSVTTTAREAILEGEEEGEGEEEEGEEGEGEEGEGVRMGRDTWLLWY